MQGFSQGKVQPSVAFFLPNLEAGGAEKNTITLLPELLKGSYRISLILAERKGEFLSQVPAAVTVADFGVPARSYTAVFFALLDYVKREQPDVIVSAFPHYNCMCLLACRIARAKTQVIATEHAALSTIYKNASSTLNAFIARFILPTLIAWLYPGAASVICVSNGVRKDIQSASKRAPTKVIGNPVALEEIASLAMQPVDALPPNTIVMAGRLHQDKDYPTALRAFAQLRATHGATLVILGRGQEEQALRTLAESLEVASAVRWLGFQENPYAYMKQASVLLLSSTQEGFGNVIVEAMACGTPVVSTDCPFGPADIIEDGKNGLLVPVKNPEAMAQALARVLDDKRFAQALSEAGKERAKDFSAAKIAAQYDSIITQACAA